MHPGFRPQLHGSHFPIQMHCNAWSLTSWELSPAFKPTERPPDLRRSTWTWKICCPAYQFEHYQGLSVQWQQSNWTKYLRNTTPFLATIRGWSVPITSFRCSPFWPTQVSYLGTKECPYMVTITFLPLNFPNITQNSGSFNGKPACILQPRFLIKNITMQLASWTLTSLCCGMWKKMFDGKYIGRDKQHVDEKGTNCFPEQHQHAKKKWCTRWNE